MNRLFRKYQRFRHCAYNVVLTQCTAIERETFFSYLYDKVQEISWKCANDTVFFDNYERYHPLSSPLYNGMGGGAIPQPPYTYGSYNPSYAYGNNQATYGNNQATGYANTNLYPGGYNRYNYYDRNRYPDTTYGNRYDSYATGPGKL